MIHPTIGRRVWYWPSENDRSNGMAVNGSDDQACDAGIAYVWSDRKVNLSVSDHNGVMHQRTSVQLLQDDDDAPDGASYAQWMPYQVGAAAKAEAKA